VCIYTHTHIYAYMCVCVCDTHKHTHTHTQRNKLRRLQWYCKMYFTFYNTILTYILIIPILI